MVQRRERVKTAHTIADFQALNQRQAQVRRFGVRFEHAFGSDFFQAGLAVVELDETLALRAQKVIIVAVAAAVFAIVITSFPVAMATMIASLYWLTCLKGRRSRDVSERSGSHRARQAVQPDESLAAMDTGAKYQRRRFRILTRHAALSNRRARRQECCAVLLRPHCPRSRRLAPHEAPARLRRGRRRLCLTAGARRSEGCSARVVPIDHRRRLAGCLQRYNSSCHKSLSLTQQKCDKCRSCGRCRTPRPSHCVSSSRRPAPAAPLLLYLRRAALEASGLAALAIRALHQVGASCAGLLYVRTMFECGRNEMPHAWAAARQSGSLLLMSARRRPTMKRWQQKMTLWRQRGGIMCRFRQGDGLW
jgi:hypothetical protein